MSSVLLHALFFAPFYQQPVEWIKQGFAFSTTQQRSRDQGVGIRKGMLGVVFLTALTFASLAAELPVEGFELQLFRSQLVLITFESLLHELGVHLHKWHVATVSHSG